MATVLLDLLNEFLTLMFSLVNSLLAYLVYIVLLFTLIAFVSLLLRYIATRPKAGLGR